MSRKSKLELIQKYYDLKFRIKDIADICEVTPSYIYRLIKQRKIK